MKARFARSAVVEQLWDNVPDNLDIYRNGNFGELTSDISRYFETDIDISDDIDSKLDIPTSGDYKEIENCKILYENLKNLNPYHARDERFWVYICHTALLNYARARWPIPAEDDAAIKHVRNHFFARNFRQIERDNAGSRLWWMAHLCDRVKGLSMDDSLYVLLYRSDVRANLIERPTTSQSVNVFAGVLRKLIDSYYGQKTLFGRQTFRNCMMLLNSFGGYILLDVLSEQKISELLDDIIYTELEITTI